MNHPLVALALVAVSMVVLSSLFADVEQEIDDPRTFEPSDFLLDQAQNIDPSKLPDLNDPNVDLSNLQLDEETLLKLAEGTLIDGNIIELVEDMELTLPEGTVLEDFEMTFDDWRGFEIPEGTRVENGELVFPPGSVLRFDDGTVLPLPDGGRMSIPGFTDAELQRAIDQGRIDAPPGSHLSAPRVIAPGDWPMKLPAGTRFVLPQDTGHSNYRTQEGEEYHVPPGTRVEPERNGQGGGGAPGPTPQRNPDATWDSESPTTTDITGWADEIRKGQSFTVDGFVHRADGSGLASAPVTVYVNETKQTPGTVIGKTHARADGTWTANVRFPDDMATGDYQLVASHDGLIVNKVLHTPSWSDPPFTVKDDAKIEPATSERVGINTPVAVGARLLDAHGVPITNANLRILIADNPTQRFNILTDDSGWAEATYTFGRAGFYEVTFTFNGNAYLGRTESSTFIEVVALGFSFDDPSALTATPGGAVPLAGTATRDGQPLPDARVTFVFNAEAFVPRATSRGPGALIMADHGVSLETQATADGSGRVQGHTLVLPEQTPLGRHTLEVYVDEPRRSPSGNPPVRVPVYVRTEMVPSTDWPGAFQIGSTPVIQFTFRDEGGRPVVGENILAVDPATNQRTQAETNGKGVAFVPYPGDLQLGGEVTIQIPGSSQAAPQSYPLAADAVRLNVTIKGAAIRGTPSEIELQLSAEDAFGRPMPQIAAGAREHMDRIGIRFGGYSTDAEWDGAKVAIAVTAPRDIEPGSYVAQVMPHLPGALLDVDLDVKVQTVLIPESVPKRYEPGRDLVLTFAARDDLGAAVEDLALTLAIKSDGGEDLLSATTDETGRANFIVAAALLDGDVVLDARSPGRDTLAPASFTGQVQPPLPVAATVSVALLAILLAGVIVGYVTLSRRHGGWRGILAAYDPRPTLEPTLRLEGRDRGLPLALAPGQPVVVALRVHAPDKGSRAAKAAQAQGKDPPRSAIAATVALRVADRQQHVQVPAKGTTIRLQDPGPGIHQIELTAKVPKGFRPGKGTQELRVLPWPRQIIHDYEQLADLAARAIPTLPSGLTPRQLEAAIRDAFPKLDAARLDAFITFYERATYSPMSVDEADWLRFAGHATKLQDRLAALERKRRAQEAAERRAAAQAAAMAPIRGPAGKGKHRRRIATAPEPDEPIWAQLPPDTGGGRT